MSVLAVVGAILIVVISPSLVLLSGVDIYAKGMPVPLRVHRILLLLSISWCLIFGYFVVKQPEEPGSLVYYMVGCYVVGVIGYAMPGLWMAFSQGNGSCSVMRKLFIDAWTQSLFPVEAVDNAISKSAEETPPPSGPVASGASQRPPNNEAAMGGDRCNMIRRWKNSFLLFIEILLKPLVVVGQVWFSAVLVILPVIALTSLLSERLEKAVGMHWALALIMICGLITIAPSYFYLSNRSKNKDPVEAVKRSSISAAMLMFFVLFALPYTPLRDRIFNVLHITGVKEEVFLVSSPASAASLRALGFSMGTLAKSDSANGGSKNSSEEVFQTVSGWVGFSFGEAMLLCQKKAQKENANAGPSKDEVDGKGRNTCFPLSRAELKSISPESIKK